jgi:hypothetical protein
MMKPSQHRRRKCPAGHGHADHQPGTERRTENFIEGSFLIEELTVLVEEAVLKEFSRLQKEAGAGSHGKNVPAQ